MDQAKKKSIGEKIRCLRGTKTIATVAEAVGVSRSSYVKYERNERNPSDTTKVKIAKYFGVTVESIFFDR